VQLQLGGAGRDSFRFNYNCVIDGYMHMQFASFDTKIQLLNPVN